MGRSIIFGDVHACWQEWQDLLEKVSVTSSDKLYAVGDLTCKGPSTKKTLEIAFSLKNLKVVMGNHDNRLVQIYRKDPDVSDPKKYHLAALRELGPDADGYIRNMASWPYYLDTPECVVVHAGFKPWLPLEKQDPNDLMTIRTTGEDAKPWYEYYEGEKLVVHGHWARQGLVVKKNVIGLDAGCVYGGKLAALILPDRKILTVPARKVYVPV